MKKVTTAFVSTLVALMASTVVGSFIKITFNKENVDIEISVEKFPLPDFLLETLLKMWLNSVVSNSQRDGYNVEDIHFSITKREDGIFSSSTFTGEELHKIPEKMPEASMAEMN